MPDHQAAILSTPFEALLQERCRWWLVSSIMHRHPVAGMYVPLLSVCFALCCALPDSSSRAFAAIGLLVIGCYVIGMMLRHFYQGPVRMLMNDLTRDLRQNVLRELVVDAARIATQENGVAAQWANQLVIAQRLSASRGRMNSANTQMIDPMAIARLASLHNALVSELGPIRATEHDEHGLDGGGQYSVSFWAAFDGGRSFHYEPGRGASRFWKHYAEILCLLRMYLALVQEQRPRSGMLSFRSSGVDMRAEEDIRHALVEEVAALRRSLRRAQSLMEMATSTTAASVTVNQAELAI